MKLFAFQILRVDHRVAEGPVNLFPENLVQALFESAGNPIERWVKAKIDLFVSI